MIGGPVPTTQQPEAREVRFDDVLGQEGCETFEHVFHVRVVVIV